MDPEELLQVVLQQFDACADVDGAVVLDAAGEVDLLTTRLHTPGAITRKFQTNAARVLPAEVVDAVTAMVGDIDTILDFGAILRACAVLEPR
ncbi:hypothetical protein [Amycolatopsis sp. cmx-4-68]|uniref:hypothetical protein n=1 Tax=Amycolatopsis sp. cmx-4-68 TaxID=2790938 RepID=UPI00397E182C